jgi:restriction endonuclease Mrr
VVLTAAPTARQASENPYHDRIEDDVLVYTGAGREGDQTLGGVNKRIPQQFELNFPIYGFIIVGSRRDRTLGRRRWRFLGLLEYLRHYPDSQVDSRKAVRNVWAFEFRILREIDLVEVKNDYPLSDSAIRESRHRLKELADETQIQRSETQVELGLDAAQVEQMRARLLGVVPERFEHLIRDLLLATGFEKVAVTRYTQDGGIDVNAYASSRMWPVRDMLVQVQAKRWLHSVGRKEVAELRGSLAPNARGTIVTTSHYSKAAITEATESQKTPIVLVDGYTLASLFMTHKLPVG